MMFYTEKRFYQRLRFWIIIILVLFFLLWIASFRAEARLLFDFIASVISLLLPEKQPVNLSLEIFRAAIVLFFNLIIFIATFYVVITVAANYVLPVSTRGEMRGVRSRLFSFILRAHGPAVFIKNGKKIASQKESKKKREGIALVDPSSAILLEKKGKLRGCGPGIVFLDKKERIKGVADLRPQLRTRKDVLAYTSDGIEVVTDLSVQFTLGEHPDVLYVTYAGERRRENLRIVCLSDRYIGGDTWETTMTQSVRVAKLADELSDEDKAEIHVAVQEYLRGEHREDILYPKLQSSGMPYIFDEQRVFSAIMSEALDAKDHEKVAWDVLPLLVGINVYRDLIAAYRYDDLYLPDKENAFPLHDFALRYSLRMRLQGVMNYQYVERADGQRIQIDDIWDSNQMIFSPTFKMRQQKVLRDRGIKVIDALFGQIVPVNEQVRQQLLDYWRTHWENVALLTKVDGEVEAMHIQAQARARAQREMVNTLMKVLSKSGNSQEAIAVRLLQILENAAANPDTRRFLPEQTLDMLEKIHEWLIPQKDKD